MEFTKRKIIFIFKSIISFGLLIILIWLTDWPRAVETLEHANKFILIYVPFLTLGGLCIASMRWITVLNDNNIKYSLKKAYYAYLLGGFYNVFLPGIIGGDVIRIGLCSKQTRCQIATATSSVLIERIFGVLSLICFIYLVYMFYPVSIVSFRFFELNSISQITIISIFILFFTLMLLLRLFIKWKPKVSRKNLNSFLHSVIITFAQLKWSTLIIVLFLSALFQALDIIATFFISNSIGLSLSLPVFFLLCQ
jgi:uncharacterized protein (TIRG00374 family)